MQKQDLKIVYMGTPDFAVEPLRRLCEGGYNVVGVITMPDKPAGRGHRVQFSPVKQYALEQGLPLLQPERLKDTAFLDQLRQWEVDLQIVVAFRMLPQVVWSMPRLGTFNLHASLLPQYRGAAPINWAIMNGETETGVTTFFLRHEIDTGEVIYQERIPIADTDDVGIVHDRLMHLGSELVLRTVDDILSGNVRSVPQEHLLPLAGTALHTAPKIFKETCQIDFHQNAKQVHDFIRGLSPIPGAWTLMAKVGEKPLTLKIYKACKTGSPTQEEPGTLMADGKWLLVACADEWLQIDTLQLSGKKKMETRDFLNGMRDINEYQTTTHS